MAFFSKIDKSADLMFGLSERMDVDLGSRVLADPELAAKEYRSMVLRCTGCCDQDGCAKLQRDHDHIDRAPDYCRNGATLNALRVK
ncbi:MAG: DUF6455 family protein [Sulfitobacter sp.]